jgi:predicted dinucleotide-utilizing enzyme
VYEQITTHPGLGLDIAFVYNRTREKLADLPPDLILEDLGAFAAKEADLIVELAHPGITRDHGTAFLEYTDYMPLSLTAFADARVEQNLLESAQKNGTRLYIPHGAIVGLEALQEGRQVWDEVKMVMKKNPANLDFGEHPDLTAEQIHSETVLYDGPARGICPLFPRNVNSHAALALGSIGFDRTHSVLVAVPGLEVSVIEIEARGQEVEVKIQRSNPMKGVSGVFTLVSALSSVCRAKAPESGLQIC